MVGDEQGSALVRHVLEAPRTNPVQAVGQDEQAQAHQELGGVNQGADGEDRHQHPQGDEHLVRLQVQHAREQRIDDRRSHQDADEVEHLGESQHRTSALLPRQDLDQRPHGDAE